jgi:hypothetical protein
MFKKYLNKLNNLPCINYQIKNQIFKIIYNDINAFVISYKKYNDKNNKTRENIIGAIN